jgi:hypothetical protein
MPKKEYLVSTILLLVVLIGVSGYCLYQSQNKYVIERFQNPSLYDSLSISMCPSGAPQIQTAKGYTDCCDGTFMNGKCQGKTLCTLSPTHDGIPSCIDYWKDYFTEKSKKVCPPRMTYYFEDITKPLNRKGCSTSPIEPSGKTPKDENSPKCIIYNSDSENKQRADSCYNEKLLGSIRCPEYKGEVPKPSKVEIGNITVFLCEYTATPGTRKACAEENGYREFLNRFWPNWENQSYAQSVRDFFCPNFIAAERRKEEEEKRLRERAAKVDQTEKLYQEAKSNVDKCQKEKEILDKKCSSVKPENCASSRQKYLQNNPDVANAKMDPWTHWNQYGKNEGRAWPPC